MCVCAHQEGFTPWWRHQMETFFALVVFCEGNPPVTFWFPSQRPVSRSFEVFFDLRLNKRFNKQSRRRWFETPSLSLWRHCNSRGCLDPKSTSTSTSAVASKFDSETQKHCCWAVSQIPWLLKDFNIESYYFDTLYVYLRFQKKCSIIYCALVRMILHSNIYLILFIHFSMQQSLDRPSEDKQRNNLI